MSETTPDGVQPDPRDIRPDGIRSYVTDNDDVEGHIGKPGEVRENSEGFRAALDEGREDFLRADGDVEGHLRVLADEGEPDGFRAMADAEEPEGFAAR